MAFELVNGPGSGRSIFKGNELVAVLTVTELDELALLLSHRLKANGVVRIGSGVGVALSDAHELHLCYSDEAEDFANAVREAGRIFGH